MPSQMICLFQDNFKAYRQLAREYVFDCNNCAENGSDDQLPKVRRCSKPPACCVLFSLCAIPSPNKHNNRGPGGVIPLLSFLFVCLCSCKVSLATEVCPSAVFLLVLLLFPCYLLCGSCVYLVFLGILVCCLIVRALH